ncbi:hypothetical protein SDJN02_00166, partial [Cucurbita argyrosperma subsp. argyrosperma]
MIWSASLYAEILEPGRLGFLILLDQLSVPSSISVHHSLIRQLEFSAFWCFIRSPLQSRFSPVKYFISELVRRNSIFVSVVRSLRTAAFIFV